MKKLILIIAFLLFTSTAHSYQLELRGQGSSVHGTYNLIYDIDRDITWYDFSKAADDWQAQVDWADALSVTFEGNTYDDWRLPATVDDLLSSFGFKANSDMGHLYYTELGNLAGGPLSNTADFQNLLSTPQGIFYWSGTEDASSPLDAWIFVFQLGLQNPNEKTGHGFGLAVRSGDVEPIPEPTTIALLGIGLAGLAGGAARRKWKKKAVDSS